jgi:neutral amino acid transport system substrate-binding protein
MTKPANPTLSLFSRRIAVFLSIGLTTACQFSDSFLVNINGGNDTSLEQEDLLDTLDNLNGPFPDNSFLVEDEQAEGLKIGAVMSYTGEFARTGQPMIEALPLLVDQVNACGGVNGESVSLVVEDDQSQPQLVAPALDKLIQVDQVDVAVVGFVPSSTPEGLDNAVQNQIPVISPGTTSPAFTEWSSQGRFNGFWARTSPSSTHQAAALARMAIDRRYRNISLVVVDNEDGIRFEQAFISHFEKLGGTILNKENPNRYNPQNEFLNTAALNAFYPFGGTPDAVIAAIDPQGGALLLRTAYDLGATGGTQLILANSFQPRSLVERVGTTFDGKPVLAGSMGTSPGASGLALDTFTTLWKQREGRSNPGVFVPHTWDAVALLVLAAQAAGSNDGEAIRDQLRLVANPPGIEVTNICTGLKLLESGQDIDFQGASGSVNLDENGDVVGSYDIWSVSDQGKVEVIHQLRLER